jgi:hypothetical protein
MTGNLEPDRRDLRASHEERDQVVEQLRVAAGDGRLTPEELDARLELALTARTHGQLEILLRDLPAAPSSTARAAKEFERLEASRGNLERVGTWAVPRHLEAKVSSGNVVIDLTQAVITYPLLDLTVEVSHGNLRLIVPPEVEVEVAGVSVRSGNVKRHRIRRAPGTPVNLRITVAGSVRHGNVTVRGPRRRFLDWLLRRPTQPQPATPR